MNKVLTTADVVTRLADKGYTKKDSAVVLGDVLDVIYEAMSDGDEVRIIGFGSFSVIDAKAKRFVNVQTGELSSVPAHKKIKFKAGEALKRAANGTGVNVAKDE